ncbi:MAG TPA: peptidylprolyl isomerase [Nitrososphaeraceae archaeon]|jgi:cyclophilin family peptidyl-prolyl cis-trans isomerase|nr:peptidylprolyl isomerase [Nitrososphaeraceae archaeon]
MAASGIITTKFGDIEVELYSDSAPKTVENFKALTKKGFYDGLIFHRIVPGFVIQGGDPYTRDTTNRRRWGTGGPGWNIKAEFNKNTHARGILSMARSQDPDSAGSQFFIVLKDSKFLDGQYTIFGKVKSGMDAVDKIATLKTDHADAPINPEQAEIIKVTVID